MDSLFYFDEETEVTRSTGPNVLQDLMSGGYVCYMFLFDLLLYVQSNQLRSCWDGQLVVLNHTVPGQAS